jgi:hypothetical protein
VVDGIERHIRKTAWKRLLLCLFGFIVARIIVTRLTGNANTNRTNTGEVSHAP